jgi:hypothetical protein
LKLHVASGKSDQVCAGGCCGKLPIAVADACAAARAPDGGAAIPGFTITITRSDDPTAQTSIRVDTAPGSARITELTVRSADGSSLPSNYLAGLDLQALLGALPSPASAASPA